MATPANWFFLVLRGFTNKNGGGERLVGLRHKFLWVLKLQGCHFLWVNKQSFVAKSTDVEGGDGPVKNCTINFVSIFFFFKCIINF